MAEECSFYYYDCGYSCALKREKEGNSSIDSDTVHRYCWGYHYRECPRYIAKNGGSSDGCFLTSACVEAKGLPDDCYELTTLRKFRDEYMRTMPDGEVDICEYYRIAPKIVDVIKHKENSKEIFNHIYTDLVNPCVQMIDNGNNQKAYEVYRSYVAYLKARFM